MSESRACSPRHTLVLLLSFALSACGALPESLQPYRAQVVQGNVVTREQVQVLRTGMSRIQVREVLGTPLLSSLFHVDRWDYVFTLKRQGVESQARRVTVFFKNDQLLRFEADELPSESEFVASLGAGIKPAKTPVLEADPEKLQDFPAPAQPEQAKPLPPLPATYPPLESAVR